MKTYPSDQAKDWKTNEHPRTVGPRKYRYHSPLISSEWYYSWIIDRFHISTRMYQLKTHGVDYSFHWLEQRLQVLGFHLVFVTRSPESFETARAKRFKVSGNPS